MQPVTISETMQILTLIAGIGGPVLAASGAFFAVKFGLNGAREDIREIKAGVRAMEECQHRQDIVLAEVRTELHETKGWVGAIEQRMESHLEDL